MKIIVDTDLYDKAMRSGSRTKSLQKLAFQKLVDEVTRQVQLLEGSTAKVKEFQSTIEGDDCTQLKVVVLDENDIVINRCSSCGQRIPITGRS